jgi:hypothetical protein
VKIVLALLSYHGRIEEQCSRLLLDLLDGPETYRDHLYQFTATLIMRITYGTSLHGNTGDLNAILASNESFNLDVRTINVLICRFEHKIFSTGDPGCPSCRVSNVANTRVHPFSYHLPSTFPWLDYLPDFMSPWRADAKRKHLQELEVGFLLHSSTFP